MPQQNGYVNIEHDHGVSHITFFHPASNSLPASILNQLAKALTKKVRTSE